MGEGPLALSDMAHQLEDGLLDRRIFSDLGIFDAEIEQVFGRTWLFLGHDSMIPEPGDFITSRMGRDSVILVRDKSGRVGAFLNTCRHRGNMVCQFDRGNATTFTCSYHGWSYANDGSLHSVPFQKAAYDDQIDRSEWGLAPVPRLASYGGLHFGCWSAEAPSLDVHLGDMRWYLDHLVLAQWGEGVEAISSRHSHRIGANWKIISENFVGDHYHTLTTHAAVYKLEMFPKVGYEKTQQPDGPFEIAVAGGHGVGGVYTGPAPLERDVQKVERLGMSSAVRRWVEDRNRRKMKALGALRDKPYMATHGTIFPNLSFSGPGGALDARGLYTWQPIGPCETDCWEWIMIERDTPDEVREWAAQGPGHDGQLASGFFAQDDAENYERVTESTAGAHARQFPFHIGMTLAQEGSWPGQDAWKIAGLPGLVGPRFSEHAQRGMYRRWFELMEARTDG